MSDATRRGGGLRRALRRLRPIADRAASATERALFPEARSAGSQWQRMVLDEAVTTYIDSLDPRRCTAVEISGDSHRDMPWKDHVSLDHPEFDLCAPLRESRRFDVVICEQVLEHVPDPCAAVANLRGLCAPGGHVVVSTPFLIKVHELPMYDMRDYWRFTPRGLRTLLEKAGLEVDAVGTWGNRAAVLGNLGRWSAYRPWHSLRNEPDVAVQVWAFARNPG